jgi:hypothetical protein
MAAILNHSTNERRSRTRSKKHQSAEQKQPQDYGKEQEFFLLFHKRPQIHKEMIHDVSLTKLGLKPRDHVCTNQEKN